MGRPFNHIQTIPQVLEYYRDSDSILCRVEKMPLTDRGKIDYDRLEAVITEQPEEDLSSADDMEQMLCGLFADVLKLKTAGADASFFELGGNSLKAFVVLSRLQERGIALTLRDLLRHPTPRALAVEIRRRNPSDTSAQDGTAEEAGGKNTYLSMKRHITANGHNVTRVKFDMKGHLGKEEFNSRIQMLVKNHPDLGSSFVQDATGKYGQEFHEEKQAAVYYRDLSRLSEPAANRLLSGFWQVMEENDDVLAAACFPLPDGNTAVLFQVEDTGADDRLARIVQDELAMNWQRGAIYLQSLYQM